MRVLFDINHPAHVHLFKHSIWALQERGHAVFITARDKDITSKLLTAYRLPFERTSAQKHGLLGNIAELIETDRKVLRTIRKQHIDLAVGTSVAVAHSSKLSSARSVVFNEDDRAANSLFPLLAYPFADYIVTPKILPEDYGKKHQRYDGYQELAYLHPNRFKANPDVLDSLDLREGEAFSLMRFVALQATHDANAIGLSLDMKRAVLKRLLEHGPVFITSEEPLPDEFEPYRLALAPDKAHDLLAFAAIFVGDSQSMTAEAAVLGTPSIRSNTFVGHISYLDELEERYGLTYGIRPEDSARLLPKIDELLSKSGLREEWQSRREAMLAEKEDVGQWMIDFFERVA